jgi:FkbM family methyltransferase
VFPQQYQITYSQNREDLILAGILRNVAVGFYVDVGANHPEFNSVTKLFYDKGWSGINIEPDEKLHAELSAQRPRDVNIRAGVASQPGSLTFRSFPLDGLSTFSSDLKGMYESMGWSAYRDSTVEVTTLTEVLRTHRPAGDIHFMKIDVEGLEMEVLMGSAWEFYRPWILCIEQTVHQSRRDAVTAFLASWRYEKLFCDGINDYYVANERREVWNGFSYGRDVLLPGIPVHSTYAAQRAAPVVARDIARPRVMTHVNDLLALDGDAFVSAAYYTLLGRPPDPEGLRNYVQELNSGVSKLSVVSKLRNSNEGQRHRVPLSGYRSARIRTWIGLSYR